MSSKHYDIAIIGGSLSARIAAVLLAKHGSKVLFLRNREASASTWFHSSLLLEKLLGILGGRACFVAQQPIQVLSRKARITLSNDVPLDDELCREFGPTGPAVAEWFERLRVQGVQLEELFWENCGLPWPSFKTTVGFKLLSMRRGVQWAELDAPVSKSLAQLPATAVALATDLLQGLALQDINRLSRAQAALLWAQAMRPENLKEPDFSALLSKRFDQFHGLKADLADLEKLDFDGSRWTGGQIRNGGKFTATGFLLGDARWAEHFKPGKMSALPAPQDLLKQMTSSLTGQLSRLLASRVICGGNMPLRLAIEERDNQLYGQILCSGEPTESQLRQQLEPALPFADYALATEEDSHSPQTAPAAASQPQSLTSLPLRIGRNLYCADSSRLLPEMGASGAALLGWTLAENLAAKRKQAQK